MRPRLDPPMRTNQHLRMSNNVVVYSFYGAVIQNMKIYAILIWGLFKNRTGENLNSAKDISHKS